MGSGSSDKNAELQGIGRGVERSSYGGKDFFHLSSTSRSLSLTHKSSQSHVNNLNCMHTHNQTTFHKFRYVKIWFWLESA